MTTKILVDDRDDAVTYSDVGRWDFAGNSNEYKGTTIWTETSGNSATLRFSGIGVSVFGTITDVNHPKPPLTVYSVDNGPETSFLGTQKNDVQYRQLFFQSAPLQSGDHTLVVRLANAGWLYLDYFEVTQAAPGPTSIKSTSAGPLPTFTSSKPSTSALPISPTPSSSSHTSTSRTTTASNTSGSSTGSRVTEIIVSTTIVTEGSTASDAIAISPSTSNNESVSIGPIVGGVLGGIVLLVLLFALVICRKRRRNVNRELDLDPDILGSNRQPAAEVTPFPIAMAQTPGTLHQSQGYSQDSYSSSGQQTSQMQSKGMYNAPSQTVTSGDNSPGSGDATTIPYANQSDSFIRSSVSEKRDPLSRPQSSVQYRTHRRLTSDTDANRYDPPPSYS